MLPRASPYSEDFVCEPLLFIGIAVCYFFAQSAFLPASS